MLGSGIDLEHDCGRQWRQGHPHFIQNSIPSPPGSCQGLKIDTPALINDHLAKLQGVSVPAGPR